MMQPAAAVSISPLRPLADRPAAPRARAASTAAGARIVWLAAADARGHVMRAHVMREVLARRGVRVDVVTTSDAGAAFLAALGTPSAVLSRAYAVAFDARQNLARGRTDATVLRYVASPRGAARDLRRLAAFCAGADLLVNDFHPAPLLAPLLGASTGDGSGALPPVVHVYGENLWHAIEHDLAGRAPAAVERACGAALRALRDRAFARVEHTLATATPGDVPAGFCAPDDGAAPVLRVPPIVHAPARDARVVRAALGVGSDTPLAAVYLNPHFRDDALAAVLERALVARGCVVHAVGEGLAHRPGWRAHDPRFVDVAAAADVLVSAPGMGAVAACAHFGTPLLALATDQPEQARNLARLRARPDARVRAVSLREDDATPGALARALDDALGALLGAGPRAPRPDAAHAAARVHARWADAFTTLLAQARARRDATTITDANPGE